MTTLTRLDIRAIIAGQNDRTVFDQAALRGLADSIRDNGLIQPITVRQVGPDLYQIVAGERRFRACQLLGWSDIPAIVADLSAEDAAAAMLSENVARADLDPIDEASAYQSRMTHFGWSVADCAERAGVSAVRVQFRLKLLRLRPDLQLLVRGGSLALGYAQILSDANLDGNRQLLAASRLSAQPKPTPGWFRTMIAQLVTEQEQGQLFDAPLFGGETTSVSAVPMIDPPHPSTTKPPSVGRTARTRLNHQVAFWRDAAEQWSAIGKPFKRQECLAASDALQSAMVLL